MKPFLQRLPCAAPLRRAALAALDACLRVPPAAALARALYRGLSRGPAVLQISLTSACNLNCVYCYVDRSRPVRPDTGRLLSILARGRALGARIVVFTGGEPFLNPDLPVLLSGAARLGLEIEILTNGTLLDEDRIAHLKTLAQKTPLCLTVKFSAGREIYLAHTGADLFDKVCSSVGACARAGLRVLTFTVLTRGEIPHAESILEQSAALGAWPVFQRYIPVRDEATDRALRIPAADYQKALLLHRRWFARRFPRASYRYLSARLRGSVCACYRDMLCLTASGRALPCPAAPESLALGDAFIQPLEEIWSEFLRRRARWLAAPESCSGCSVFELCGGGCLSHRFRASGSFDSPDPLCAAPSVVPSVEGLSTPCRLREGGGAPR